MGKKPKHETKIYVPCASVNPTSLHIYHYPIDGFKYGARHAQNSINLEDNDHHGRISNQARKKICASLTWLLFGAKSKRVFDSHSNKYFSFKINFITLTLPSKQEHSDQEIKDIALNNFLAVLRKNGLVNYLWRAEAQPLTGNIHFHITTDKYFHYDNVRKWWNQSINLLGYIDRFQSKFMHDNPNSTDIHSVKHVRNLPAYLSKYMAKDRRFPCIGDLRFVNGEIKEVLYGSIEYREEEAYKKKGKLVGHVIGAEIRPIEGKLWGRSTSLSRIKNVRIDGMEHDIKPLFDFVQQSELYRRPSDWVDSYFGDIAGEAYKYFPDLHKALTAKLENTVTKAHKLQ